LPMLNLGCYVSLCEGLRAGAGSLSYIVHVDCCGLSTIVIGLKTIIIIIIIISRNVFEIFIDIKKYTDLEIRVTGHSRSSKVSPFDRLPTVSY